MIQLIEAVPRAVLYKAAGSLALAVALVVLRALILRLDRRRSDPQARFAFRNIVNISMLALFLAGMVLIWLESLRPLLTFLGIIAVGLTIVSKELILNFLSLQVILGRELFSVGDRVRLGDLTGDVTEKGLLYFTLLEVAGDGSGQSTGRLVKVPNSLVLTVPVVNATKGFAEIWHEVSLTVTLASDWQRMRELMLAAGESQAERNKLDLEAIAKRMRKHQAVFRKLTPTVYTSVTDAGIRLTLRFLCPARSRRAAHDAVTRELLEALAKEQGITLALGG